jgi:hypothetical protein
MNSLTKVLLEDLLEADGKKVTAIYGGGFKPPTKGHFDVVQTATEQNPEINDFIIYVGGGTRDGIAQAESIMIWEIYKKYLPLKVKVEAVKSPIGDILRYAKEHPDEEVLWVIGARENNPEDFADIASRTRTMEKYPNLQLRVIQTAGGVSGTAARKAVRDNNKEQFFHLIPNIPEKEQVWDIVSPIIKENIFKDLKGVLKSIWSKGGKLTQDIIDGAKREGKETSKLVQLLNKMLHGDSITDDEKTFMKAQGKDLLKILPLVAIQGIPLPIPITPLLLVLGKKFGFNILPDSHEVMPLSNLAEVNNFYQKALSQTEKEALELTYKNWDTFGGKECNNGFCDIFAKNLSKYLPGSKIMSTEDPRNNTLGHVWVEYEGKYFDAETPNGVESWKQLPWMIEFYSKNKSYPTDIETLNEIVTDTDIICDNCGWKWAKKDGGNDLYICHKCGHDNAPKQLNENSIPSIDIRSKLKQLDKYMLDKGYNIEPLPTVELIDDDVKNAENFLGRTAFYDPNEKKIVLYTYGRHPKDICRSYTHEMVHHIQNLENRLGDVSTTNTLEDDHVADLEKEANLKGTMTFRNFTDSLKENKDPFGLLEDLIDEGRYDSIVTQLARYTIKGWKDDQEHGEPTGRVEFEVGPGKDLEYGDLEFLYKGIAVFADVDLYSHNGYARANSGEVGITFSIPTSELPKMWERIYNDVTNTLRHEIEHLTQSGKNVKPNKAMASDSDIRNKMGAADKQDPDYFLLPKEIDANLQGLYLKAKKTRQPFSKVVDNYLKYDLNLSLDDQEKVRNAWRSRIKALSLPKI